MRGVRQVVVTGLGIVLPGCRDRHRLWEQIRSGESQLRFIDNPARALGEFDRESEVGLTIPRKVAAGIVDMDVEEVLRPLREKLRGTPSRALGFQLAALALALNDAKLDLFPGGDHEGRSCTQRDRIGIFDGTSRDGFAYWYDKFQGDDGAPPAFSRRDLVPGMPGIGAGLGASIFGIQGPAYTYSGSCCSGAIAIGHAYREIEHGEIDVALAGGHDAALSAPLYRMYGEAGLLSTEAEDATRAVRPFGGNTGNAFGEGAVVLVLESREHAERRGAEILATIDGYRYANGGTHPTHIDPSGEPVTRLAQALLTSRGMSPEDVGFVVGHGNGVSQSDQSELSYMRKIFGHLPHETPIFSTKPLYGHTLGASSAVNVAAAVVMLRYGTAHTGNAALSVSYGIGGNHTVVLVKRDERHASRSEALDGQAA